MRRPAVSRAEFEKLVARVLADLPLEFRQRLDNIEVVTHSL